MLDIEQPAALAAYLRQTGRVAPGEALTVQRLSGGVSNRTVLVRRSGGHGAEGPPPGDWVVKQALPKLRVEVDWFCDPARIQREAAGLRWLFELAPPGTITRLLFEDQAQGLLAMEAVPAPHENWKTVLLAGRIEWERVRQFARLLGTVHGRAYARRGGGRALHRPPFFRGPAVGAVLRVHGRPGAGRCRVSARPGGPNPSHGSNAGPRRLQPQNILLYGPRMVLLDHEVVHWGDPAFDLGFSLTHLLSKAHHLPQQRPALAEAAALYWREYQAALGDVPWRGDLEMRAVRHTLACLLARVAGRSPLEYLGPSQRAAQQAAVVPLLPAPPGSIEALIAAFIEGLGT